MEKCKGWKNGCNCDNCLRLHGILTDPRIASKEEIEKAEKRQWLHEHKQGRKEKKEKK